MFTKPILDTPLTSEIADRLFSNITASGALDSSFPATMRALLRKRLPQDESVKLTCKRLNFSVNEISSVAVNQSMARFVPPEISYTVPSEHHVMIVYTASQEAGEKMLEIVRANAGAGKRYMKEYALQEDLRAFYARKLNALFYTDKNQNTVIFADKLELKHFHVLQMMLPKYLPELFVNNPLSEKETALLKSLGNKSAVEYETLITEFAKEFDIRSEIIRTKLSGFETAFERIRLDEIKTEIKTYQKNYDTFLTEMQSLNLKIQESRYLLAGLECAVSEHSGDSELMEYFMCNKNLSIISVQGTAIEFVVHGYADVYDVEAFEKYVENHRGFMYSNLSASVTKPQMEKLYKAIFSENRYKLRLCAAYTADIRTGLKAISCYDFPPESKDYLPNPHIQTHGCIGNYATRFQEYMKKQDYVGAIDQAVVSARNLNFYDSTVISTLAKTLSSSQVKCIEKADKTCITPLEAIKELEELWQDQ